MGKVIETASEVILGDRLATFTPEQLFAMPTAKANKAGMVLAEHRVTVNLKDENGVPVEFTASLYIQRAPVDDAEREAVNRVKTEREENTAKRKKEDQDKLEREKQAAYRYGQDGVMSALKNIGDLQRAASALAAQVGIKP